MKLSVVYAWIAIIGAIILVLMGQFWIALAWFVGYILGALTFIQDVKERTGRFPSELNPGASYGRSITEDLQEMLKRQRAIADQRKFEMLQRAENPRTDD